MPWREVSIVEQREEFVRLAIQPGSNVRFLSRRFGISPTTAYKVLQRYRDRGREGLTELSRRPHHSPLRCDPQIERAVLELRGRHPAWGARKIRSRLLAKGVANLPAASTVHAILVRYHLIDPRESAKHKPWKRFEHDSPNQLWQMDFKGYFPTRKALCHPLTVLDDHSRFALCLQACPNEQTRTVQHSLSCTFRRYGLPERISVDNGPPWGSDSEHRFTPLTVWLLRLGVLVSHSRPYHPQTQGKDERFHRTLNVELLQNRFFRDLPDAQHHFDAWRDLYNLQRPHQAIGMAVPADRYQPSTRPFPEALPSLQYNRSDFIRKVQQLGVISFRNRSFNIGSAFYGQLVAVRPTQQDGLFDVFFSHQKIAQIDLVNPKIS